MSGTEQLLIGNGLTTTVAKAVVTRALEERVRGHFAPLKASERQESLHRGFSIAAGLRCILLGFLYGEAWSAAKTAIWLVLPICCIWFPSVTAPGENTFLIRWGGWLATIAILGYRIMLLLVVLWD